MKIDFTRQTVLITGATRGLGEKMADDFAQLGAHLILTGSDKTKINMLNKKNKNPLKKYYAVDFSNRKSTQLFIKKLDKYRRIDVCINNAGINRINYIDETLIKDWDDLMAVNLEAPFMITRKISKIMKRNRYGRIINISSVFGVNSKEKRSIYTITKFGIRGLTVSSAIELAPYNVLVNTVSPGFVLTDLTKRILGKKGMKEMAKQVPMGRLALPEEISKVVLFLASKYNTYITGQNIIVDGGFINV